jgi:hypothetical protein
VIGGSSADAVTCVGYELDGWRDGLGMNINFVRLLLIHN